MILYHFHCCNTFSRTRKHRTERFNKLGVCTKGKLHRLEGDGFSIHGYCNRGHVKMLKVAFQRTMSFLFGSPFEKSTRVFLFVRATEKHTTLVDAFLFHLSGYTQKSVTTHWKYWSSIILFHHIFNQTHRRKPTVPIT